MKPSRQPEVIRSRMKDMRNSHLFGAILLVSLSAEAAVASDGDCRIEVERLWADPPKYESRVVLRDGEWHYFRIDGTQISCNFAFYGLEKGTMISCNFDPLGMEFAQSDRSGLSEPPINNLSFRFNGNQVYLWTACTTR